MHDQPVQGTGASRFAQRQIERHRRPAPVADRCVHGSDFLMSGKELFLEYVQAYNAKDVSAMLAFFGEACVFENISGGKVTVRTEGKGELEALARRSAEAFAWREQKVISLTEDRERIPAEIDYHAVLCADLSRELKAGSRLDLRGITVCEFSEGKIVRLSDYS